MPLETANYISQLDQSNPDGLTDYVNQGDDHLRLIKTTLVQSFPNIDGPVDFSTTELNDLRDNITHSGTSFDLQGNTLSNVTSLNSDTAVEPRLYNDTRYVRQGNVVSDDILLGNNKQLNVSQADTTVRPAVNMSASDVLEIGGTSNITNLLGSAIQINGMSLFNLFYPIGTIYENGSVSTNPGTLLGFGTWTAFGTGRVLVAIDAGNTVDASRFGSIGQTGGSTTHTLTESEIPAHKHIWDSTHAQTHTWLYGTSGTNANVAVGGNVSNIAMPYTSTVGGGTAHNNTQPYIVVYRWIRVA